MEKQYSYEYKGFIISITRNKRKDVFIDSIIRLTNGYKESILFPRNVIGLSFFLTLKSAKNKAIQFIDDFDLNG